MISKQLEFFELLRHTIAIVWNEAAMANQYAFKALDRILKDILENDSPFEGKVMILGGDF